MSALFFGLIPALSAQLTASVDAIPERKEEIKISEADVAKTLNARLTEIKKMDKRGLSAIQKKELRDEVKAIKSELKANGGGVYLSLGGILLIILLLVLLL